jgi:glycosyltransferase involved in cell wall biosynthesis
MSGHVSGPGSVSLGATGIAQQVAMLMSATAQPPLAASAQPVPPQPQVRESAALTFSLIVPTFRRLHGLAMLLESLAWQRWQGAVELIVVDNDPRASAKPTVDAWTPPAGWTVRYALEREPGKVAALNRGLGLAGAPLIASFDDDIMLSPEALAAYAHAVVAWPDVDYFGGPHLPTCVGGVPRGCEVQGRHRLYLAWPLHDLGPVDRLYGPRESPMGGNRLLRRSLLARGVRFEDRFLRHGLRWSPADDIYFAQRLRAMAVPMVYVAAAKVLHMTERGAFNPAALRRRYREMGKYEMLADEAPATWRRYRYLLRALPSEVAHAVAHALRGDRAAARYHRCEVSRLAGMLSAWWTRWRAGWTRIRAARSHG